MLRWKDAMLKGCPAVAASLYIHAAHAYKLSITRLFAFCVERVSSVELFKAADIPTSV